MEEVEDVERKRFRSRRRQVLRAQASGSLGLAALAATTSQRLSSGCDLGKWAAVGWREVRRYVDMRCGYIVYSCP
jgi:carbohydrate-selective porin OprB